MKKILSVKDIMLIVLGSVLFGVTLNLFIVPLNLYNGGIIGIAQLIRTFLNEALNLNFSFDIAGVINLFINLPLLFIAYKFLSKKFLIGTCISIVTQTITLSLVPIPTTLILDDILSSCIVGGILSGVGVGIVLLRCTSAGGIDIIGVLLTLKTKSFSVGKLGIIVNAFIYLICAFVFDLSVALYSLIYAVICSLTLDRIHLQNIEVSLMIFTKKQDVKERIMEEFKRGVTCWKGMGGYTHQETEVIVTIVSKYEVERVKKAIHELDSSAFIIVSEGLKVSGGYEKRLI